MRTIILCITLLGIYTFQVNGNIFDYLPEELCDSLVVGFTSNSSLEGKS